jgi:hypothetical protein
LLKVGLLDKLSIMREIGKALEIQERGLKKLHIPEGAPYLGKKNGYPGSSFASKRPGSIQVTDSIGSK